MGPRHLTIFAILSLAGAFGLVACGGKDTSKKAALQQPAGENDPSKPQPTPEVTPELDADGNPIVPAGTPDTDAAADAGFIPTPGAAEAAENEKRFDTKSGKTGDGIKEQFLLSPSGSEPDLLSENMTIVCRSSLTEAAGQKLEVGLTPGSSIMVKKAGETTDKVLSLKCDGTASAEASKAPVLNEKISERVLPYGELAVEVSQGKMFFISCSKNDKSLSMTNMNGLQLLSGSSLLLWRDLDYQYSDGATAANQPPVSIIHCR